MCNHRWRHAGSLSRAQCRLCFLKLERAAPDPDGSWHDKMPVAMKAAMRRIKHPSTTQAAQALA